MKNFSAFSVKMALVVLLCAALFFGCNSENASGSDVLDVDTSYAFGMLVANEMGLYDLSFNYTAFMEGFRDFNEQTETRITQDEAMEKLNTVFADMQAKYDEQMQLEGQANQEEGNAYLAENGAKAGVTTTLSGLQYEVVTQGSGEKPGPNDTVTCHYEGTFIDGSTFDSSYERGTPSEFPVTGVIPGWTEGLQLMNVGSTFRFVIPSELAYGAQGNPAVPPNTVLIFTVELISIAQPE